MNDYPTRKKLRIEDYDYTSAGAYFITVCTAKRENLFWFDVGADSIRPSCVSLSEIGALVEKAVLQIPEHYENISVDKYCIMPDHIHLIVRICSDDNGLPLSAPDISTVIGSMKRWVSRQAGRPIWQKSYFDHVVRGQRDYDEIWQYIENNPLKYLSTGG